MRLPGLCAAALFLVAAPSQAQPGSAEQRILADMAVLTSDGMEGRRPGTSGERKTVRELIAMFHRVGLEPGAGGGWRQPVPLAERRPVRAQFAVRGGDDISGDVLLIGERPAMRVSGAQVRYVDHAQAVAPAPGMILLYRDQTPADAPFAPDSDNVARYERLAVSGAAMALAIVDDRIIARQRQRMPLGVIEAAGAARAPIRGYISEAAAQRLLAGGVVVDARVETAVRRFTSVNVIGRLRGATEPGRALVYSAHWDAFGRCRPGEADAICNGGIDNASGIAGLLEIARWFVAGPRPDRSILFVATTAEEHGLLGMRAYAARPVVPLADTVAAINVDTIALYGAGHPVGFVGGGLTDLDPIIARLVAGQGRTLDEGAGPAFVARSSDAWPMLRGGVPSVILSNVIARTGPDKGAAFQNFITTRAHFPSDDMRDLELGGAIEDLRLMHALGLDLARRDAWPDFLPGSRFSRPRSVRRTAGN
ncbi:M28 family peptidase [Sphingomonas sp.]|uniref:M28 family peptidase n=1 Tax=Sphingomonas sp. TaxID=28214 RepID=UPI002DD6AAF4|nr:M28 family peptidase [Sphingomonas sp.]